MQVKVDLENGKVYENWLDYYDRSFISFEDKENTIMRSNWDKLPEIEVENLEEYKKKINYLYKEDRSLHEQIKSYQIMYNLAMNKLNNINNECTNNSNDSTVLPLNNLGWDDFFLNKEVDKT